MTSGVTAGVNISYDKAFDTRVSADIKVRFGGAATAAKRKEVQQLPVINALTSTPSNRDVRVHDKFCWQAFVPIAGLMSPCVDKAFKYVFSSKPGGIFHKHHK